MKSFINKHNVEFIKYLFVDLNGCLKEVEVTKYSCLNAEDREYRIMFDGSSVPGYGNIQKSDL